MILGRKPFHTHFLNGRFNSSELKTQTWRRVDTGVELVLVVGRGGVGVGWRSNLCNCRVGETPRQIVVEKSGPCSNLPNCVWTLRSSESLNQNEHDLWSSVAENHPERSRGSSARPSTRLGAVSSPAHPSAASHLVMRLYCLMMRPSPQTAKNGCSALLEL